MPADRDWPTEQDAQRLSGRWDELARLLAHRTRIPPSAPEWVDAHFQGEPLRAESLDTVFQDVRFKVQRAEASPGADATVYHGPDGFATALEKLRQPVPASATIRAKFKIYRIESDAEQIRTTVHFRLSAADAQPRVQQQADWHCIWQRRDDGPVLLKITVTDYEEITTHGPGGPAFVDCTQSALGADGAYRRQLVWGLDHWLERIEGRFGIEISGWQGLAVADVNGDALEDLYLCQAGGLPNRLFLQNPDGTATDHAAAAQVDWRDHSHGALFLDLDNDGDQDLVLATALGLIVMSNDGQGRFQTEATKLVPEAAPLSLAAADFDQDGDLDLYAACYSIRGNTAERRFLGRPIPYHDANNGGRNVLFRNEGNWNFRDVTQAVGLDENNRRFSMAAAWEDFDNDGDQDLYVANDYGRNNLYRNDGGRFRDVAAAAGVEDISAGMSVSWSDVNHDGWMDLYVSNMFSSAGNRIAYQRHFQAAADQQVRQSLQRHARGNSLFLNAQDGTFRDVSQPWGVTMGRWAWASRFVDINSDGWDDLVVANGFITQANPDDL